MIRYFRKGFTDAKLHEMFVNAVRDGDCGEIAAVVHAQGMERLPVDCMVNALKRRPFAQRTGLAPTAPIPEFGSSEYTRALQFVADISEQRDDRLDKIQGPHRGYNELSPFLADVQVDLFKPGTDYGTTEKRHREIQSGAALDHPISGKKTLIKTGRDAASYVFNDDPVTPWERFMNTIIDEGVELQLPEYLFSTVARAQANFTVYGKPFFKGLLGSLLLEAAQHSFRVKWDTLAPRPEESGPPILSQYIPQAYRLGSPMHCSSGQMHGYAAYSAYGLIMSFVKDGDVKLTFTGESIEDSGRLLAQNISAFRVIAGVHFQHDEDMIRDMAISHGEAVAKPYLE